MKIYSLVLRAALMWSVKAVLIAEAATSLNIFAQELLLLELVLTLKSRYKSQLLSKMISLVLADFMI